jgi:hypothetical protein
VNILETACDASGVKITILRDTHPDITCDRYYNELSRDIRVSIRHEAKFLQFFRKFLLYSNRCTCLENAGKGALTCKERVSSSTFS